MPPYVPTGKPRGRRPGQKNKTEINTSLTNNEDDSMNEQSIEGNDDGSHLELAETQKKSKNGYVPTGKPRGRRPGQKNKIKTDVTPADDTDSSINEKREGRRKGREENRNVSPLQMPERQKKKRKYDYVPTGTPRGRRPGQKNKKTINAERRRAGRAIKISEI